MSMADAVLIYGPTKKETKNRIEKDSAGRAIALQEAQECAISLMHSNWIISCEDGEFPATLHNLQEAMAIASTEELNRFCEKHYLPFDGGYIMEVK